MTMRIAPPARGDDIAGRIAPAFRPGSQMLRSALALSSLGCGQLVVPRKGLQIGGGHRLIAIKAQALLLDECALPRALKTCWHVGKRCVDEAGLHADRCAGGTGSPRRGHLFRSSAGSAFGRHP